MGYATEEIGPLAATSKEPVPISGVCAVFAESEVINHLSPGRAARRHHARRHRLARRPLGPADEARADGAGVHAGRRHPALRDDGAVSCARSSTLSSTCPRRIWCSSWAPSARPPWGSTVCASCGKRKEPPKWPGRVWRHEGGRTIRELRVASPGASRRRGDHARCRRRSAVGGSGLGKAFRDRRTTRPPRWSTSIDNWNSRSGSSRFEPPGRRGIAPIAALCRPCTWRWSIPAGRKRSPAAHRP